MGVGPGDRGGVVLSRAPWPRCGDAEMPPGGAAAGSGCEATGFTQGKQKQKTAGATDQSANAGDPRHPGPGTI